jgi:flagellar biogenesis protein FliO
MKQEAYFRLERKSVDIDFENRLMSIIQNEGQKVRQRSFWTRVVVSVGSLVSIVLVSISLVKNVLASGFYDYASIMFLDFGSATMYMKDISLSLVESLPLLTLSLFLSLVVVFVWSVRSMGHFTGFRFSNSQKAFN